MSNLNFESILDVIRMYIDKTTESFPYSEQGEGVIVKENSSGNYTVTYKGANINAIDLNKGTKHKEGDCVYLLLAKNNDGKNYILGSTSGQTEEDISYIFKTFNFEQLTDNLNNFTDSISSSSFEEELEISCWDAVDDSDIGIIFETTRSFILNVKLKISGSGKNIGNYYFKIKFDNETEIIFNTIDFFGNPYEFYTPTLQTLYFTAPNGANSITEILFGIDDVFKRSGFAVEASDIELYGTHEKNHFNDCKVKISFPAAEKSAFTSNNNSVKLAATLEYNEKTYSPIGALYFWEYLDSPVINGQNWIPLNIGTEKKVGETQYTEYVGRTINEAEFSKQNYFENFYRCKIQYLGFTKVSEPFSVINYNLPNFSAIINFENQKDTLLKSNENIVAKCEVKLLKGNLNDNYTVEYAWYDNGVLIENKNENKLTITSTTGAKKGERNYFCRVTLKHDGVIVGGKDVDFKIYDYVFTNSTFEFSEQIYFKNDSITPPEKPNFAYPNTGSGWKFSNDNLGYTFISERKVLVQKNDDGKYQWIGYGEDNSNGEYYQHETTYKIDNVEKTIIYYSKERNPKSETKYALSEELTKNPTEWTEPICCEIYGGTNALVNQINIFNQLTQNGTQDGFFWSNDGIESYVLTEDTEIVQDKDYYAKTESGYTLVATPQKENLGTYYEKKKTNLYINATFVEASTLNVPGKLFASVEKNEVSIGGFSVGEKILFAGSDTTYVAMGVGELLNPLNGNTAECFLVGGKNFAVTKDGTLYANSAKFSGEVKNSNDKDESIISFSAAAGQPFITTRTTNQNSWLYIKKNGIFQSGWRLNDKNTTISTLSIQDGELYADFTASGDSNKASYSFSLFANRTSDRKKINHIFLGILDRQTTSSLAAYDLYIGNQNPLNKTVAVGTWRFEKIDILTPWQSNILPSTSPELGNKGQPFKTHYSTDSACVNDSDEGMRIYLAEGEPNLFTGWTTSGDGRRLAFVNGLCIVAGPTSET